MKRLADLLDRLAFTTRPDRRRALLVDYFRNVPDPDRGYGLAALIGALDMRRLRPALLRGLIADRLDDELFRLSHDYVGDLAETVALTWPAPEGDAGRLALADVVETLRMTGQARLLGQIVAWLDRLPASERWALLKLTTGKLSTGVTPALVRDALAEVGGVSAGEIAEIWHGLSPPYTDLFAWLTGDGQRPALDAEAGYRALKQARTLEPAALDDLDPAAFQAEWLWDGRRVLLAADAGTVRLYDGDGDDITERFPDLVGDVVFDAVLDGVLLVVRNGVVAPYDVLQRRLGRRRASQRAIAENPAHLRVFDLLAEGGEDLRTLPLERRRQRLEDWHARHRPMGIDLSPVVDIADWSDLTGGRMTDAPLGSVGVILKRLDATYDAAASAGDWLACPRAPHHVDAVLLYAERGQGGRAADLTNCTFGVWRDGDLMPVGKAALDLAQSEQERFAAWVADHASERYGPVTRVAPDLVLRVAFDDVIRAAKRKAGLMLRGPRLAEIRWDTPAAAADRVETLKALLSD